MRDLEYKQKLAINNRCKKILKKYYIWKKSYKKKTLKWKNKLQNSINLIKIFKNKVKINNKVKLNWRRPKKIFHCC